MKPEPKRSSTLGYADLPRLVAVTEGDEKHSGAPNSTLDVLWGD